MVLGRAGLRPRVVHRGHDQVPLSARVQRRGCRACSSMPWSAWAAAAATAAHGTGVSWRLARSAPARPAATLPDVDALAPKRSGSTSTAPCSVRRRVVPMDADRAVDDHDRGLEHGPRAWHRGRPRQPRAWETALSRPAYLEARGVETVVINPSAALRKALWLPWTAASVDRFHLVT